MSGSLFSMLSKCIKQLKSDKITERKKQVEILQNLLNKPEIIKLLDKNTDRKKKQDSQPGELMFQLTWDVVFKGVQDYIFEEAERLQKKQGEKLSVIVLNNLNKDKLACSTLFKNFVKIANKRKPRLNTLYLVNQIDFVLGDEFLCSILGLDCTNILVKDVLTVNQLYSDINLRSYQSLITRYMSLIQSPPTSWDRCLLTEALYLLTDKALSLYNMKPQFMFDFFSSILKTVKLEKTIIYQEGILSSLLLLCRNVGIDCRQQLCHLGEEVMAYLIHLWNNKPNEKIRELLLEFFMFQVSSHHPCGTKSLMDGTFACNWDAWLDHLKKLYDMIHSDLKAFINKNKYSSYKDRSLKPKFLAVAVEICHQIFSLDIPYRPMYFSQLSATSSYDLTSTSKKQCLEASIQHLVTLLQHLSSTEDVIPLLQLLSGLLSKYPESMNSEELMSFLEMLCQMNLSCKQLNIKQWLLNCINAALVACCHWKKKFSNEFNVGSFYLICENLWETAIKTVALNHCHEECHQLLQAMLLYKLITPKIEFYQLYSRGSGNLLSKSSIQTLLIFMQQYSISSCSNLPLILNRDINMTENTKFWFQNQILGWLFYTNDDQMNFFLNSNLSDIDIIPLLAQLFVEISVENTENIKYSFRAKLLMDVQISEWRWIAELEEEYLKMSFDVFAFRDWSKEMADSVKSTRLLDGKHGKIIVPVWKLIQELIMKASGEVLEQFMKSDSIKTDILFNSVYLIIKTLQNMFQCSIPSMEQITKSGFGELAKNLIETALNKITTFEETKTIIQLVTLLHILENVLTDEIYKIIDVYNKKILTKWIISILPSKLINILLKVISSKETSTSNITNLSKIYQQDECDSDNDFNGASTSTKECINLSDGLSNDISLIDETNSVENVHFKCAVILFELHQHTIFSQIELTDVLEKITEKLFTILEQNVSSKIWNTEVVLKIIKYILMKNSPIIAKHLEIIVSNLRCILNKHHKEQNISIACLDVLTLLIPYLSFQNCFNELTEIRCRAVHLIHVFWERQAEHKCSKDVTYAVVTAISKLLEQDPFEEWTRWVEHNDGQRSRLLFHNFTKLFHNQHYPIRTCAALGVRYLFQEKNRHVPSSVQSEMFEEIYVSATSSLQLSNNNNSLIYGDEKSNMTTSLLLSLSYVILSSSYCEKSAIFAICQSIKERNISVECVIKALSQVSKILEYGSLSKFMESHLQFLINRWIKEKYNLEEFPFQLLQCKNFTEFCANYHTTLVPVIFHYHDLTTLQTVCKKINCDWLEILRDCLPQLIAQILPWFAIADEVENVEEQRYASKSHSLLEDILTKSVVENALEQKLENVIMCLLNLIEETKTECKGKSCNCSIPQPNPPSFSVEILQTTINYLMNQCCTDKNKSLVGLLSRKQDGIQKILLFLHVKLEKAHRMYEERRILLMYHIFLKLLLSEMNEGLGGNSSFIIRDIIIRIMHYLDRKRLPNLEETNNEIIVLCIDLVQKLCYKCFPRYANIIGEQLPRIVGIVSSYAENSTKLGKDALLLLKYLLIENTKHLENAIRHLDPLPNKPEFEEITEVRKDLISEAGLEDEMSCFLSSNSIGQSSYRLEGLQHLFNQIKTRKEELQIMINSLQARRLFSEDIDSSVLHKIICCLIHISNHGEVKIQELATRCLGEIGPIDLSTLVLQPSSSFQQKKEMMDYFDNAKSQYKSYYIILNLLNEMLQDERIEVVSATSQVLKNILSTKTGIDFISFYKRQKVGILHLYFHPFLTDRKNPILKLSINNSAGSLDYINNISLWSPEHCTHEEWIVKLVVGLLKSAISEDEILQLLEPICEIEAKFCEKIFPYLICAILMQEDETVRDIISNQIAAFFSKHCSSEIDLINSSIGQSSQKTNIHETAPVYKCKASVQTMLSVIHYLRCNQKYGNPDATVWDNQYWLDINYLHVAQAAQFCSAPFTSLLYTEIWCDAEMRNKNSELSNIDENLESRDSPVLLAVGSSSSEKSKLANKLIMEAYSCIGEKDGEYGCQDIDVYSTSNQISYYVREKQWDRLLSVQDLYVPNSSNKLKADIVKTMQQFGLYNIMQDYINGIITTNSEPSTQLLECQNECAWRLSQWDVLNVDSSEIGFHHALYRSLTSLVSKNQDSFTENLNIGRNVVVESFCHLSLESVRSVYPVLCNLQMLATVEEYSQTLWQNSDLSSVCLKWQKQEKALYSDFEFLEPVLWLQCVLLKQHIGNLLPGNAKEYLIDLLQKYIKRALSENYIESAQRAIYLLGDLTKQNNISLQCKIEDAKIHWMKKEYSIAKQKLKYILKSFENCSEYEIYGLKAKALMLYGEWLSETCSANVNTILKDCFEMAVDSLQSEVSKDSPVLWDAYLSVARYTDIQYQRIVNYVKSSVYQSKQELLQHSRQEVGETKHQLSLDDKKSLILIKRQIKIDEEETIALQKNQIEYLKKSIENYLKCLKGTDKHDLRIFRLTALWFQNNDNENINKLMKDNIYHIQTYKFLPLMYQLAARMGISQRNNDSDFNSILSELIQRIILDHPHHGLPVILALYNAEADLSENGNTSVHHINSEERIEAAKQIINKLKTFTLMELVTEMQVVCSAYIKLAYFDLKGSRKSGNIKLPFGHPILQIKEFSNIPIFTEEIKINRDCNYENIPGIKSFLPEYQLCGGINCPKVVTCIATNGKRHKQLVKGRDDLRQDAVMQQVFNLVNCLLQNNARTKKRKLNIRTYKVVPLSRRSGVLQWCEGTQPLCRYLVGENLQSGAHKKYFPKDMTAHQCMKAMKDAVPLSAEKKEEVFNHICKNFHPVFRYFFLEHFTEPSSWFERHLAYIQSVATSSIIGYILGLGDRHVNNILIDLYTAEVVHIDFGIAFERGMILGTPETVPFRLTRDIVDGMGICGTEGVFKRCCEKTMEVMRNSQEILCTILEVFLYDPLCDWTISPKHAASRQHRQERYVSDSFELNNILTFGLKHEECFNQKQGLEEVNKVAERALLRLQQKLQGIENGVTMSISGQVNMLIQQARDPSNLCRLYYGWQPYL